VRVRTIEIRLLGLALAALWLAAFVLVLLGYRPGGPVDTIVGFTASGPFLIALAGVVWPPAARGDRAFAAIAWLGLGAILLLIPSLVGVIDQLTSLGPQTLLPSLEAAYPWALALLATALFSGFGVARLRLGVTAMRRRRLAVGTGLGLAFVLAAGGTFATAAAVNELSLRDRPALASRFGPTDPLRELPACDAALIAGPTAAVTLLMDAAVDGRRSGQVRIDGLRNGPDVRWTGYAATSTVLGSIGLIRVGSDAWELAPGTPWRPTTYDRAVGADLDRQFVAEALRAPIRAVSEDRGIEFIEGARTRHCRVTIDGDTLGRALPEVELLLGKADLALWRSTVDYWVFADGQLGQADGQANGPALGIAEDALSATLRFRITAIDRGQPITVRPPIGQ
jgi:hypothetical protein